MPDFPTRATAAHEHLACGHKTGPRCIGSEPPPPDGDDAGGRLAMKLTTGFFGSVLGIPRLPFGFTTGSVLAAILGRKHRRATRGLSRRAVRREGWAQLWATAAAHR